MIYYADYNYNIYTKPHILFKILNKNYYILKTLLVLFSITGLYVSFFIAPTDYQQGEVYRILYIHVPSAWLALSIYTLISMFSFIFLIKKHPLLIFLIKSLSITGILFTILALFTGSIWGKPMWGTWWIWDARLTSVLLLLIIYLGHSIIMYSSITESKKYRISSIYSIIGFLIIPLIKFSVNWWNTLHQPSSISSYGSTIHESMLYPLILILFTFLVYILIIIILVLKKNIILQKMNVYKSLL